ncbi:MAG: type I secretion C-terminal target domain-containing protein [Alphaproteobacteria bacterium]|nr:type I secretion C-terminal target domain-containing protein [Alphaproteobacteria bacterium]
MTQSINTTTLSSIAGVTFQDFVNSYNSGNNVASSYYNELASQGASTGNTSVENYGKLARDVTTNNGPNGKMGNAYSAAVADDSNIDFSVGSNNWLRMQYELMQNDLVARQDSIQQGGTGELDYSQTNQIHTDAFGDVGLGPEAFTLYTPTNALGQVNHDVAQALFEGMMTDAGLGDNMFMDGLGLDILNDWADTTGVEYWDWLGHVFEAMYDDPSILGEAAGEEFQDFLTLLNNSGQGVSDWLNNFMNNGSGGQDSNSDGRSDGDGSTGNPGNPGMPGDPHNPENPQNPGDPGSPQTPQLPRSPDQVPDHKLSPLVLDLDGDGVELYTVGDYGTYFDLNGDGQATLTGWVEPDDGLLALDVNGNGFIDNIFELFGSGTTDGFALLGAYDSNGDGVIGSSDSVFSNLLVWTDTNSDGISQASELHTLSELGIASISLDALRLADQEISGNSITHEATYTLSDGTERQIVDAWFDDEPLFSQNATDYTLDIRVAFLPTLRGYGQLKDLSIAASIDNSSDPSSLIEKLTALSSNITLSDVFSDWGTLESDTQDLLYRWAGIENVDPNGRGPYVDGQHLAFYEAFRGADFNQYGHSDPLPQAGSFVEAIYDYLLTFSTVQLVAQTAGQNIFTGAYYDAYRGGMSGDLTLSQSGIDAVKDEAIASGDAVSVWTHFAQFLGYTVGLDNLSVSEISALDSAVAATNDPALSNWQSVEAAMEASFGALIQTQDDWSNFEAPYENLTNGTSGDDTITDDNAFGNLNNEFYGHAGNDIINAMDGNDKIDAGDGNDTLIGGAGDDVLIGGLGDDTYVYDSGNDTISEVDGGGVDEIHIAASTGLTQADLTLYRQGDELNLLFNNGGFITIDGYNTTNGRIETIVFDYDSTQIDLTALTNETFYGTEGFDDFTASGQSIETLLVFGYGGNDILRISGGSGDVYGGDGYDTLIGGDLNDELHGEADDDYLLGQGGDDTLDGGDGKDSLDGGAGNDILSGGNGDDIFYYGLGYGNDLIERTAYNNDRVVFNSDVLPADLELYRDAAAQGRDLTFIISATGEQLTVEDMFAKNNVWLYAIDRFEFADGTIWTNDSIRLKYIADNTTSSDDTTLGFESDDVFYSSLGNDTLTGYSGDDVYYWGSGAGNDVIYDQTLNLNNDNLGDRIVFEGLNFSDLSFAELNDDLIITNNNTSETLTVNRQFYTNSSYYIEAFEFADGTVFSDADVRNLVKGTFIDDPNAINGTDAGEYIYGDPNGASDDIINGLDGNDHIYGYEGNDLMAGGNGADILYGGNGDDGYVWSVGDESDTIYEESGTDQLIVHSAQIGDILFEKSGTYDLKLVIGSETIKLDNQLKSDYTGSNYDQYQIETMVLDDGTVVNLTNDLTFKGTESGEYVYGLKHGDDTIYGLGGNDTIYSYDGNDTLIGGAGNDTLRGDDNDDTYIWSPGDGYDVIYEESGTDQLVLQNVLESQIRFEKVGNMDLKIYIDSETITVDNQFKSDYYNSSLYDTDRVETLHLDNGTTIDLISNLTFTGTSSSDTVNGLKNGADTLSGLAGDDTLNSYAGDDVLYGGDGADTLYAGSGNDVLYGGTGADTLYGESGADTFVFEPDASVDTVEDFSVSEGDKLDVSEILSGYDPQSDVITDFIQITDSGANSILSVDVDGGADNFVQIATLLGVTGLTDEVALEASGTLITV